MTEGDEMTKLPPMRLISCAATTQAVINRTKTVTRRWGWGTDKIVKVGDCLRVINKSRRNYSQPESITLACVEVVGIRRKIQRESWRFRDMSHASSTNPHAYDLAHRSLADFFDEEMDYAHGLGAGYEIELSREGCRGMTYIAFVDLLAGMAPKHPSVLTRIEWVYREDLLEAWRASKGVRP